LRSGNAGEGIKAGRTIEIGEVEVGVLGVEDEFELLDFQNS